MSTRRTTEGARKRLHVAWAILPGAVIVSIAIWPYWAGNSEPSLPASVTRQQYQRACEAFQLKYGRQPNQVDTLSWLAEWNLSIDNPTVAIDCFAAIPTSHPEYGRMARYQQGRTLLALHRAVEAEAQFLELIPLEELNPQIEPRYVVDARDKLRHILEVELRFEERQQLLSGIIDRNENDTFEAVVYCFPTLLRWNGPESIQWLEEFHRAGPRCSKLDIALGRYRTGQGRLDEARSILDQVHRDAPDDLRAAAALIACLHEQDELDTARAVLQKLPRQSDADPWQLLMQRGSFALQDGGGKAALAAYDQMLHHVRTSAEAWQGVVQATRITGDLDRRKTALEMVAALGRRQNHLGKPIQNAADPNSFLDVADLCAEFGLVREGALMTRCARQIAPKQERVQSTVRRYQELLARENLPPLLGS